MKLSDVKFDCRHFKGEIPCLPNKLRNKVCTCDEYEPISTKILIIKLGAIGDVIRTTPLVTRFKKIYPQAQITWITNSPDILPKNHVDKVFPFDFKSVFLVTHESYDIAINLDKDKEACQLLADVAARLKFGFTWNPDPSGHHIDATTPEADHKLITGFFDNISKENKKNYLEEIFEICNLKFEGEEFLLNYNEQLADKWKIIRQQAAGKTIVGLNTGCGKRWLTRLWPQPYWIELIKQLQQNGYYPILLGGKDEDGMNHHYQHATDAYYPGTFSLEEFIAITSQCDIIVTAVSMMMHIAIGLKKKLILFNNIFNPNEYYLYGRGEIIQPTTGCDDYYGNICTRTHHCMNDIAVEKVFEAVKRWSI